MASSWSGRAAIRESAFTDDSLYLWPLRVLENLHQTFRLNESGEKQVLTILLVLDLLSLHLYASVDHMELLAGKEGFEEAQTSYTTLQQWVESREARPSLWHAGQLLKLSRALLSETVTDFHCVIIYHVSLCLWTYGTIMNQKYDRGLSSAQSGLSPPRMQDVLLDGEETFEIQSWIAFNRGRPVVSNPMRDRASDLQPVLSLQSTEALMEGIIQIVKSKYPGGNVLPPVTENLCCLMHALGTTTRRDAQNELIPHTNYSADCVPLGGEHAVDNIPLSSAKRVLRPVMYLPDL